VTAFADAWIRAWNTRDLDTILSHYTEEVEFRNPKAAAPSSVLWGVVAARIGYARALALAYAALACGIILPLHGGAAAASTSAVLFGGTFLGIAALTLTLAGRLVPHRATVVIGVLTAAFGVGQVAGPTLAGLVAGRADTFTPALVAASAVVAIGGALMAALHPFDPSRRDATVPSAVGIPMDRRAE
jgi:MFS family permease